MSDAIKTDVIGFVDSRVPTVLYKGSFI